MNFVCHVSCLRLHRHAALLHVCKGQPLRALTLLLDSVRSQLADFYVKSDDKQEDEVQASAANAVQVGDGVD